MIRRFFFDDLLPWSWTPSWTFRTVDTERYDVINGEVVPRKDLKERLVRQKEEEIKSFDDYYKRRKKELADEREKLIGKKSIT